MSRSVYITRKGGPEVLAIREGEPGEVGPGEIRIQVTASGVNFADIMMRSGLYPEAPKTPFIPGYEVAGKVINVGRSVTGFAAGERVVAGCRFGGYTSEIVLPSELVRKIPAGLSDTEAAAIPVTFMTAWVALQEMARVRKGDRVLIPSAAGGVGLAAVQIAALAGAHVVGLVGNPAKSEIVKSFGAAEVWPNDAKGGGFDIVLDSTGGPGLKDSFERLSRTGRLVNYGVSTMVVGETRSISKAVSTLVRTPFFHPMKLMNENKGVFGVNLLRLFEDPGLLGRVFDQVLDGFERGEFRVRVGKTFPLAEAGAAQQHLQSRANVGKVVLLP